MILGNIKDAKKYYSLHKGFKEVFEFLETLSVENCAEGMVGDGYRVNLSGEYMNTVDAYAEGEPPTFESHREYIDIHYCIDGCEGIGYNDISKIVPTTEYFSEDDYQLHTGEFSLLKLTPGDFCIVFPEDAHIPCLAGGDEKRVLKAVAKIKV